MKNVPTETTMTYSFSITEVFEALKAKHPELSNVSFDDMSVYVTENYGFKSESQLVFYRLRKREEYGETKEER